MKNLNEVSKTLYVPMGGRIYATKHFPHIFYDDMSIKLQDKIPEESLKYSLQSQYTFMASAIRSKKIDEVIKDFLDNNKDSNIIELGCGLETTYFRVGNKESKWYEIDLEEVILLRKEIIPEQDNMVYISSSIFDDDVIEKLKEKCGDKPTLFIASGLFHYFTEDMVLSLLNKFKSFNNASIVFDAVSKLGMRATKKYMQKLKKENAYMYFYVDKPNELTKKIGDNVVLISNSDLYTNICKKGMNLLTKLSMFISDKLHMVKIIYIKLS